MAKKTFKGRPVIPGNLTGTAMVSPQAFNTSASYFENMFGGRTDAAPCTDANNKYLYGKNLSNMILCTTQTVGSTLGGCTIMGMKELGVGPQALLFSRHIDTLAAAGVVMEDIWNDKEIITIDLLGDEFLETVQMGDPITIHSDGTVEIG